jgi:hypothetical protein
MYTESNEKAAMSALDRLEAGLITPEEFARTAPPKYPWYWNDEVNPWNAAYHGNMENLLALHRSRDEDPDDREVLLMMSDVHEEMGDTDGAEFYRWMAAHDRRADLYNTFWWFDNNLLLPKESRYVIPSAVLLMMQHGQLRYPLPATDAAGVEVYDSRIGCRTDIGVNGPPINTKLTELGFDGRVTAETTLLAGWRGMTRAEKDHVLAWDYDWVEPSREEAPTKVTT